MKKPVRRKVVGGCGGVTTPHGGAMVDGSAAFEYIKMQINVDRRKQFQA